QIGTASALTQLQALDTGGVYDYNHVYTGSGAITAADSDAVTAGASDKPKHMMDTPDSAAAVQVGLIDGGLDTRHIVFRNATVHRWGCDNKPAPSAHGTAVASLMVGKAGHFRGVVPGASLYAADVYCNTNTGGAVDNIVGALAWFAKERIAVVNISLVGPPNQMLERGVRAMLSHGHMLVAAVGNDGPAAPPLYPASYPGVIGVSAVDVQGRVLPEAARGSQVMFAAPGNGIVAAAIGDPPYRVVRGTSFASPLVAAMLATYISQPNPVAARLALAQLARQAVPPDADRITKEVGYGVLGEAFVVKPEQMR
ncbi:MAG: S8 family serine peptidase, partial [Pseudomonadota bacterium]